MASDEGDRSKQSRGAWLRGSFAPPALLLASIGIVVRLFFGGAPQPPAPSPRQARVETSTTASIAAPDSDRRAREPSPYCVSRFLTPLRTLGGLPPVAEVRPAPSSTVLIGTVADAGAGLLGVTLAPAPAIAPAPREPFAALVGAARDRLDGARGRSVAIDVRIATLPDPIDSGSRYLYDAALQSLRLGVERGTLDGYRFFRDASWLPWDDTSRDAMRSESEACRYGTPGIVVFRGEAPPDDHARARVQAAQPGQAAQPADVTRADGDPPRFVALLLVGETPVTGAHRAALVNALAIAEQLRGAAPVASPGVCRKIVGPVFSGSATSIRAALETWASEAGAPSCPRDSVVRVRAGSATGPDVGETIGGAPLLVAGASIPVDFARTTRTERDVQCEFLAYAQAVLHVEGVADPDRRRGTILRGVALLHESGTQFGDAVTHGGCPLSAEISLSFPFHVSAIRDAYEALDERARNAAEKTPAAGRTTALEASLRESRRPPDDESQPSPKTTSAEDTSLTNLLGELSREGVHYVGIQATDSSDAIFLARKVRDIAPDVRLVFFQSDILLTHPSFRRDLLGSFVVTPYPFFGADDFSRRKDGATRAAEGPGGVRFHAHEPFDGALAEGIFNAVLAAEGFPADELAEYTFFEDATDVSAGSSAAGAAGGSSAAGDATAARAGVLPIWIATISRAGMEPVHVRKQPACSDTYAGKAPRGAVVSCADETVAGAELDVDPDKSPPNVWHFLYAALIAATAVDWAHQRRQRAVMSNVALDDAPAGEVDRRLDLALGRTKYHFYLSVRAFAFVIALGYVGAVHLLALRAYGQARGGPLPATMLVAGALAFLLALRAFWRSIVRYRARLVQIRHFLRRPASAAQGTPDTPDSLRGGGYDARGAPLFERVWASGATTLGFEECPGRWSAAETSLRQLRLLTAATVLVAVAFSCALGLDLVAHGFTAQCFWSSRRPAPEMTIFVLRSLPLVNGVSPSAPVLLSLACVYAWTFGRLARLRLAHGLSLISPPDSVDDAVSTPIRYILFPRPESGGRDPEDFTRVERQLLNAIWRPSTGPRYFAWLALMSVFPVIVFLLKVPSTLESRSGTILLFGALSLSSVLIAATLLQFGAYWRSLELLLKRILAHPLGHAFEWVDGFVREPIEDQVSRSPNDLLRLSAVASRFVDLVRTHPGATGARGEPASPAEPVASNDWTSSPVALIALRDSLVTERNRALRASTSPASPAQATVAAGELLGRKIIESAAAVCRILDVAWATPGTAASTRSAHDAPRTSARDPLTPLEDGVHPATLAWLRSAQAFVATVVALLVNRHVRQFRYFAYTLTGMALLLLLSLSSYAFEPFRLLLTCIWVIMATVVGLGFWIFIELEQNTLLSLISGTEPGKVTVNSTFFLRIVGWVILPLVSVAAAQYPEVGGALSSWVEPLTHALR